MPDTAALIDTCSREALKLLHDNLRPEGMLAAAPTAQAEARRYTRVFGRDHAICALAMAASDSPQLRDGALHGLLTLAAHQAENGQIPKYVDDSTGDGGGADFWYLGCIDATLWWLIALRLVARRLDDARVEQRLKRQVARALTWLQCQEHQRIHLLQQNEASDWADIMPRSGFVLYSNALWYYVKRLYALPHAEETRRHFNELFFPFARQLPEYRRLRLLTHYVRDHAQNRELYLSFVNLGFFGDEGDVFGNLLAILLGLADGSRASHILRAIQRAQADAPYPLRATCSTIGQDDPLWRAYMGRHQQNLEYQYHNGGIWPLLGGFWVMALAAAGKPRLARTELARLARANAVNQWEFNEWFHGRSGAPCGMPRQSWSAAAFLLARQALNGRVF